MPSLRTLAHGFAPKARAFFKLARRLYPAAGLVVTSARRTYAEQRRLFERSQRGENGGLPATPPGQSDHEVGLAWDMARLNVDPLTDPVLRDLGARWQAPPWNGRWWSGDPVHFAAGRHAARTWRSRKRRPRRTST